MEMRRDHFRRLEDIGEVRLPVVIERRRHADDDAIRLFEMCEIDGRVKTAIGLEHLCFFIRNMLDIGLPHFQELDLIPVDVETVALESRLHELYDQRQTGVAQPDDTDRRASCCDLFKHIHDVFLSRDEAAAPVHPARSRCPRMDVRGDRPPDPLFPRSVVPHFQAYCARTVRCSRSGFAQGT